MNKEQKIKESAFQCFILNGYKGTTIDEIARTAGVSKTSVHYYLRDKDTLYFLLIEEISNELVQPVSISSGKLLFLLHEIRSNKKMLLTTLENIKQLPWEMLIIQELKRAPSTLFVELL
ncbi:TetR/AcrR family transcriptional regulator [Salinivirga cyanobacteriivorans]